MTVLNHLAQAAAIILLLELMVVLLVFLAVAGGLAFGLRWVNGKSETGFSLARDYSRKAAGYVHTGTGYAAMPVIVVRKYAETAGATAEAIKHRVRRIEAARSTVPAVSAVTTEQPVAAAPIAATVEAPVGARPVEPS
jgi:hypothetical protein